MKAAVCIHALLPCIVKQYIITLAFDGHICSHMIKPSISILRWMFHFTPFDCVPSAAIHISFTRQVKSAAPFIRHVVRPTDFNSCVAANPAQMLHRCRRCSGCSSIKRGFTVHLTWKHLISVILISALLFHCMLSLLHASSVSLEQDEAFFPRCMSDLFYNKGLINGSQVSNPLPSTIAQRLMRKRERSFAAACLYSFVQVMQFRKRDRGKWSADYLPDPFSDSSCRFLSVCRHTPTAASKPSVVKVIINI